jgi:hypothetical protein
MDKTPQQEHTMVEKTQEQPHFVVEKTATNVMDCFYLSRVKHHQDV